MHVEHLLQQEFETVDMLKASTYELGLCGYLQEASVCPLPSTRHKGR